RRTERRPRRAGDGQRPPGGRDPPRRGRPPPGACGPGAGRHAVGLATDRPGGRARPVEALGEAGAGGPAERLPPAPPPPPRAPPPAGGGPGGGAAGGHEVVALGLTDPREEPLPDAGLIAVEDAEGGARRAVDSGSRRVRTAYAQAAAARREAFRRWCTATGVA